MMSRTSPAGRCCTYSRSSALAASFAVFGRRAISSAFHCATDARYSSLPPPVAALRRSSWRPSTANDQAAERSRHPGALRLQQRDLLPLLKAQNRHETGSSMNVAMRHAPGTIGCQPPAHADRLRRVVAAQALRDPPQDAPSTSRRCDGLPGDFIGDLPVNSFIHPTGLPSTTSSIEVLRRPVESAPSFLACRSVRS
jgi:hypothetical protein